jgi:hypothetical protein
MIYAKHRDMVDTLVRAVRNDLAVRSDASKASVTTATESILKELGRLEEVELMYGRPKVTHG